MARYYVHIHGLQLLVVLSSSALVSALRDKIKQRLPSLQSSDTDIADGDVVLHLHSGDGPILDVEDVLSDAVQDPTTEEIHAVICVDGKTEIPKIQTGTRSLASKYLKPAAQTPLRIRVITPELARSHPDITKIPLVHQDAVTLNSTLSELKARVQQHLGLPAESDTHEKQECNCALARKIDADAVPNELNGSPIDSSCSLIVIHGDSQISCINISEPTRAALVRSAKAHLSTQAEGKHLEVVGGVEDPDHHTSSDMRYIVLPVIACCSHGRHGHRPITSHHDSASQRLSNFNLDIHTAEMSIEVTAQNSTLTISDVGLAECTINGVLNLYAVKRHAPDDDEGPQMRGKDAIFRKSKAWEHPLGQSERGLASLLSTLRVFAHLTSAREMDPSEQDAILHIFYLLTRFPPAVRSIHVLLMGKSISQPEQAAITQCVYEVLKTVIPLQTVKHDSARLLEGSRLLFGLILEKAKHIKHSGNDAAEVLPYIDTAHVYDLQSAITMEPVTSPIQTMAGLVDRGLYDAFKDGGILRWTNGVCLDTVANFDHGLNRAVLLAGGTRSQVISFEIDAVNNSRRYLDRGVVDNVISPAEYSNLPYLATLCSRNQLGVVHPSSLPSTEPPSLTLDRLGSLAVYVGRQPCGDPGNDIIQFRPTNGDDIEESVDVSIITQLLVPILEQRKADGTAVFEGFGDRHRQLKDPDEVVMLVIDCSSSMDSRCGFIDVEANEDAYLGPDKKDNLDDELAKAAKDRRFDMSELDDMKELLSTHESFGDMLAIVHTGTDDFLRHKNAQKVLKILRQLYEQEIQAKTEALNSSRLRSTERWFRQEADRIERQINILKDRSIQLCQYEDLLSAFLLYRSENASTLDAPLTWTAGIGHSVPTLARTTHVPHDTPKFTIPHHLLCPISTEIMTDPVSTTDGFVYERKNIERWLRSNETSPCTNLRLDDLQLRPAIPIKEGLSSWSSGTDILSKYGWSLFPNPVANLKSDLQQWSVALPRSISVKDVYELAFRSTKGRYTRFVLNHRNKLLPPSDELFFPQVRENGDVFITPFDETTRMADGATKELCLVKVYDGYQSPDNVISYWESRETTRSLGSTVFRYYRQKFLQNRFTRIHGPLVVWTDMANRGDNRYRGGPKDHWEPLQNFFKSEHCKGQLSEEPLCTTEEDEYTPADRSQPHVLKLYLGSAPRKRLQTQTSRTLSRMDVLKAMFDSYLNRTLAYNMNTHMGLVTFRSTAALAQQITHSIENFRHELNNITASGDTACWDAIALARDQLLVYAAKFPKARLRILCLSDGEDNKSKTIVSDIAMKLWQAKIVVDSFCLGQAKNLDLKTISYLTGGFKFQPDTMENAMAICEMEPVLSQLERPDINLPAGPRHLTSYGAISHFNRAKHHITVDIVNRDVFPKRRENPGLSESFVELGAFTRKFDIAKRSDGNLRSSRLLSEMRNAGAKPHPYYDIYICESNMGLWKVVMQGPPGSAYETGVFLLYLEMGEGYPAFAPSSRFVTLVYHPNINVHGKICHSIFDRNWTIDTTCKDILDTIFGMLLVPEFSDPINAVVTLDFHWDEVQFKEEAKKHIEKHAKKTRAEWKEAIVA